jgi:O-antigen ligase
MSTRVLPLWRANRDWDWFDNGAVWALLAICSVVPIVLLAKRLPEHAVLIAFSAVMVIAVMVAIMLRPAWGALALILVDYWNLSDVVNKQFNFPWLLRLIIIWTFLAWGTRYLLMGKNAPKLRLPLLRPILIYLGAFLVSVALADFKDVALDGLLDLVKSLAIFYLVVNLLPSPRKLLSGIFAIMVAALLMSAPVVFQQVTGSRFDFWGLAQTTYASLFGDQWGYRASGSIGDPNFFGLILVASLPLSIVQALGGRSKKRRIFALFVLALTLLAIGFTYSRGAMVGIGFVALAMAAGHKRRELVVAGAAVLLLGVLVYMPKEYSLRMLTLRDISVSTDQQRIADASYRGRRSELLVGWEMFKDHPIWGVGPGNYGPDYLKYNAIVGLDERHTSREAHNLFMQTASETGLVGLSAFLFLIGTALWKTWKTILKLRAAGANRFAGLTWALEVSMGVYLLLSFFLHGAYFRHFMILLGLAALAVWLGEELISKPASTQWRRLTPASEPTRLLSPEHA